MTTIRKEMTKDIAAREALLDRAFGAARFTKAAERLREGRLPADGLSFVATDNEPRRRHCPALARLRRAGAAGAAARPARGRRRVARPRDRRGSDAARHRGRAAARPQGRAAGRRCALLRPLRLLGREDRRAVDARPVTSADRLLARELRAGRARRRARPDQRDRRAPNAHPRPRHPDRGPRPHRHARRAPPDFAPDKESIDHERARPA